MAACTDYLEFSGAFHGDGYTRAELEVLFGIGDGAYFRLWDYQKELWQFLNRNISGIDVSFPFSWKFPENVGRRLPYRMHAFTAQSCLMIEYWKTMDARYRDLFIAWVLDWIRAHLQRDDSDPWAWHDDATARRVYFFNVALVLFEKILSEEQIQNIRASLRRQIQILCGEDFYRQDHNHGMFQDRALALYGLTLSEEPEYHLTLAMERSAMYFQSAVTEDGVHKEHSPMYHIDIARNMSWFVLAYRDFQPEYSRKLKKVLDLMGDFPVWLTMPDGTLPPVGDSIPMTCREAIWPENPGYLWITSRGTAGQPPDAAARLFPAAGYGVIRGDWSLDGSGTWMLLTAATHSAAHKHNDDLNFLIYHRGELFTEAGNRNYDYADPMTEYVYSSYAHNVLFVNGEGWKMKSNHLPLLDAAAFETQITGGETEGPFPYVSVRQTRFPGIIQDRSLSYDRALQRVEVRDRITLEKASALRLIYHIAPGVEVRENAHGWMLSRDGTPVAEVTADGSAALHRKTYTGDGEAPWRPWVFQGRLEPRGGTLLALDMWGGAGENTMCLWVKLLGRGST